MKDKAKEINRLLIDHFGIPYRSEQAPEPVDMLIATILSQNTNDKNSFRAYRNLRERYSGWEEAGNASREEIEEIIKVAGLGKQKSAAIKNLLKELKAKRGEITLGNLEAREDDDILEELTSYPGIGVKTASCVLLFALERNICPVDTHVHRTLNRTGLAKTKSPDKTFEAIQDFIPDDSAHQFHTNLIRLGREICKPKNPSCIICPLEKICEFPDKNYSEAKTPAEQNFMLLDNVR